MKRIILFITIFINIHCLAQPKIIKVNPFTKVSESLVFYVLQLEIKILFEK